MRKIHINKQEWKYSIGKVFVNIWSPNGKRFNIKRDEVLGYPKTVNYGNYIENKHGSLIDWNQSLSPSKVKKYIETHLHKFK